MRNKLTLERLIISLGCGFAMRIVLNSINGKLRIYVGILLIYVYDINMIISNTRIKKYINKYY